ncbi:MAG: chromate transporter [Erysipelotrichaceae bacterium]|jgi:chromate transporter|nr:chromate transporter [Erysipelotrichaceae bacterium]HPY79496.1 chromate transporter [Bacilli bacterium]HQA55564.1 chromate transporter [Bacilli bacterium]
MRKKNTFATIFNLFLTFMKIGALTFGGGYAMISIIEREVVEKNRWINQSEMMDIFSISESTPGPISVNTATFVGYRVAGFWGSLFATLGLIFPSFIIILLISFFYQTFLSWTIIQAAFLGIRAGVIILLIDAVIKLKRVLKFTPMTIALFVLTIGLTAASFFFNFSFGIGSFKFSLSIILILLGMVIGIIATALNKGGQKE